MPLEKLGDYEGAPDEHIAFLLNLPQSKARDAVIALVGPLAVEIIQADPDIIATAAAAAAELAQSDAGLARGVKPVERRVVAGTVDADGRAADDAIGLDGHFFQHTYDEIERRAGRGRYPAAPIVAGTVDADGRLGDDVIGPDGHFLKHTIDNIRSRIGDLGATGVAFPEITGVGDSLMETVGTDAVQVAGTTLGIPAHNAGRSGMLMEHIALTMGGLHVRFNVAGNAIGSSTSPVTLTRVAPVRGSAAFSIGSNDYTWHGYLTGAQGQRVHGVLTQRSGTGGWDFAPYSVGPSVPMKPGALFTPYLPQDMRDTVVIINGGRNNPYDLANGSWANVAKDLDKTVASLGHSRFIVLTITTRLIAAERTGEPQRLLIDEENARRVATYPDNCFDLNRWMHEEAVSYLGLAPDPQDDIDLAQGWIPRRLYVGDAVSDQTHFKGTVYAAWGAQYANFITTKGLTL